MILIEFNMTKRYNDNVFITVGKYPVLLGRGYNKSFTVGVSFPDCDKASGGMRTDLQWKVAKATANLAPIPLRAELNIKTLVKYAVSI